MDSVRVERALRPGRTWRCSQHNINKMKGIKTMKPNGPINFRLLILLLFCVAATWTFAQSPNVIISGVVMDRNSRDVLSQVNVSIPGAHVSTVTNEDGYFVLKTDVLPDRIMLSHIGYKSRYMNIDANNKENLKIHMSPSSIMLREIVINPDDPLDILNQALLRISENYGRKPRLMQTFYRETAQKRSRYIYVAEAVAELMKTGYNHNINHDWVAIVKGRSLVSPRKTDTLGVKIEGGPVLANSLDVVKNRDFIFNTEELQHYRFSMSVPEMIDDRLQCVILMEPAMLADYALYHGKFYVDNENYTITRAELTLDMRDHVKATQLMLVKKPMGVRFKPKELSVLVNFKKDGEFSRIHYVRTVMRFNCDWKRRLMSSPFTVVTEMVVTDQLQEVHGRPGKGTFSKWDSFYDKLDLFNDPDFWKDYNIIEPSESLESGIAKIKRQH